MSKGLGITDNAVRQHITAFERDGMVIKGETQSSGGRPPALRGGVRSLRTDSGEYILKFENAS